MIKFFEVVFQSVEAEALKLAKASPSIAIALTLMFVFWLISKGVGAAVDRAIQRREDAQRNRHFIASIARWAILLIGLSMALEIVGLGKIANKILAGGGLVAVAFGFAFKEIGENLIAGFMLMIHRPFRLGDVIRSGDSEGTVKALYKISLATSLIHGLI